MAQFLVSIAMQLVVENDGDVEQVAEDVYSQCAELAYTDDHLLSLEVSPCPLPPAIRSGSRDNGDPAPHET